MTTLGNIIWVIFGGLITAALYIVAGLLMCITIIGIPFGVKLMKLGMLSFLPFGKEITTDPQSGCLSFGFNILWILGGWWEIALVHAFFGLIFFITIIGIPFAKMHFRIAEYALLPFGRTIT